MILKISLHILFMNSLALANRSCVLLGAVEQSRLVMWPGAFMSAAGIVCCLTRSAIRPLIAPFIGNVVTIEIELTYRLCLRNKC